MGAQNNDYLIYEMRASQLLEAYEQREILRQFCDPDGEALLDEVFTNGADIGYIRGLVRRQDLIKQSGHQALDRALPPVYMEQIKQLKTDRRHIGLFRDYEPGKAKLFEVQRQAMCRKIGGHLTWMAID